MSNRILNFIAQGFFSTIVPVNRSILLLTVIATVWFVSRTAFAQEAAVHVSLSPAGSFVGKTKDVKGFAVSDGKSYSAKNIVVSLKGLKTGKDLRDEHTQKYLETEKYPEAVLISAQGNSGKGSGRIKIRGIEKDIKGEYQISGKNLVASFPISLDEFGIKGIRYAGVGVKDKVTVKVNIPINAADPSARTPAKAAGR